MAIQFKTALLVGASSGIGKVLASHLHAAGVKVVVCARRKANLDALAAGHRGMVAASLDIADLPSIPAFARRITAEHPDIDAVILNAGIQRVLDFARPATIDLAQVDGEITTNYTAQLHLTTAFLPHLIGKGSSQLHFVTSGLAFVPMPRVPSYCATKAALHHFALALRAQMEAARTGVKIVEIIPPYVESELHDEKHQPGATRPRMAAMPTADFVRAVMEGYEEGLDEIAVGSARRSYDAVEGARKPLFEFMKGLLPG